MKPVVLIGVSILLMGSAAAAPGIIIHGDSVHGLAVGGGFSADLKALQVDENVTLNVTVVNPLPVPDTLQVEVAGPAISTNRIVKPYFPSPPCNTVTTTTREVCTLTGIPANGRENITITLQGTKEGQERLVGKVNSTLTDLGAQADIQIRVEPRYGSPGAFSAPGISLPHLILLPLLAAALRGRDRNP